MRTVLRWLAISSLLVASASMSMARTRPHYGGTLRLELTETQWLENDAARLLVLDTLTVAGSAGEAQPSLATQWEAQNGARRWRFQLRKGVTWQDGAPLTSESVAVAMRQLLPGSALENCTVRAEGDAIIIESTGALPQLPAMLALPYFAIVRTDEGQVIGTGAFMVAKSSPNRVELTANEMCWHGRPYIDAVVITTGRTLRQQWMDAAVKSTDVATVPAELLRRAEQERLRPISSGNNELIALQSTATGLTLDVRLRQALAATLDRAVLLSFAFQKQGEVASGVLPNWMTGYTALFSAAPDLTRARELRMMAGQSRSLMIGYPAEDQTLQLVAERIALNAREAGIQAQATSATQADFAVARIPLPSAQPQIALEMLAATVKTELTIASSESEELFRAERELLTQSNMVPLLYVPRAYAVTERVHGAVVDDCGEMKLGAAWIEEHR